MQCRRSGPLSVPQPQQLPAPAQVAAAPLLVSQGVKHRVLAANIARHGVLAAHIGVLAAHIGVLAGHVAAHAGVLAGQVWVIAGRIGVLAAHIGVLAGYVAGYTGVLAGQVWVLAGNIWVLAGQVAGSAAGHIGEVHPGYPVARGQWQSAWVAGLLRVKGHPLSLFVTHGDTVTEDNVLRWPELGEN